MKKHIGKYFILLCYFILALFTPIFAIELSDVDLIAPARPIAPLTEKEKQQLNIYFENPLDFAVANESVKSDKRLVLEIVKNDGMQLRYASDSLKNDADIVKAAILQNGNAFQFASKRIRGAALMVSEAIKQNPLSIQYALPHLKNHYQLVLFAVQKNGMSLQYVSDSLKDDSRIVKESVIETPYSLQFASDRLKKDREIISIALKQDPLTIAFVDPFLREDLIKDKFFVLDILQFQPAFISFVEAALFDDKEVIKTVVQKDGRYLKYASNRLRDNKKIILTAIENTPRDLYSYLGKDYLDHPLKYASNRLRKDRGVATKAVKRNGAALQYVSDKLKDDRKIVRVAIKQNALFIQFASMHLQQDKAFSWCNQLIESLTQNYCLADDYKNQGMVSPYNCRIYDQQKQMLKGFKAADYWVDDMAVYPELKMRIQTQLHEAGLFQEVLSRIRVNYLWQLQEFPMQLIFRLSFSRPSPVYVEDKKMKNIVSYVAVAEKTADRWDLFPVQKVLDETVDMNVFDQYDVWDLIDFNEDGQKEILFKVTRGDIEYLTLYQKDKKQGYQPIFAGCIQGL